MNRSDFNNIVSFIFICAFLSGCKLINYVKKDIDLADNEVKIEQQKPDSQNFLKFIEKTDQNLFDDFEKGWNANNLLVAMYFFNSNIKSAKKQYDSVKANEVIAKFRPQSSIGVEFGSGDGANEDISDSVEGLGILYPFETANKRLIRYEIALNKSQSSYEDYQLTAWNERIQLIESLIKYTFNIEMIKTIKLELISRQAIFNMNLKRFENGLIDQISLNKSKLDFQSTENKLKEMQLLQITLRKEISISAGMRIDFFEQKPILTKDIIAELLDNLDNFLDNKVFNEWNENAALSKIKLRKILADYAVSEAELKLEIAKQYPDIKFSPAYLYDFGDKIWTLGLSSIVPNLSKNKALISRAEKIRDLEGSKVDNVQLQLKNNILSISELLQQSTSKFNEAKNLLFEKDKLLESLQKQYKNGILSRYDFENEAIKLIKIDYIYQDNLYNHLINAIQIEKIYDKAFVSKINIVIPPNEE